MMMNIKYLISEKSGITECINHDFARIRIETCNSLLIEKILIFHKFIILIKSIVNKNKNHYCYNIFLEKGLYKGRSDIWYFQMFVILQMLYLDRIDFSKWIDGNKTSGSKECDIF